MATKLPTVSPTELKERYMKLIQERRSTAEEMEALRQADPSVP